MKQNCLLLFSGDECKSTVSDTWSTDVLASDSEPPEQNQVDRLEEVAEEIARPLLLGSEACQTILLMLFLVIVSGLPYSEKKKKI